MPPDFSPIISRASL